LASKHISAIFAFAILKNMRENILYLVILLFVIPIVSIFPENNKPFTIIIDAGHGGKDPGALGSIVREKDVVLDVALRFGKLINENNPEVNVMYTRQTDIFIPLEKRTDIANKAKANLFISIHSDWIDNKSVHGASTYTLGQNRSQENFEIAKRENSVILLEDNYKKRYEGFDPNSAESYIMFEFMQDNYMNQSIKFASILQKKFTDSGRYDRGVRQAAFWVLRGASMPSTLVELGFLTNRDEEIFLKSDAGRSQMAECLYKAFAVFKNDYERKSGVKIESSRDTRNNVDTPETKMNRFAQVKDDIIKDTSKSIMVKNDNPKNDNVIVFKIQLLLSPKLINKNDRRFKGIEMEYYIDKGIYKYTFGSWTNFKDADNKRKDLSAQFPDAFVIAFKNGQRMTIDEAKKETSK
jgi:N-acetylmuramoyl-L-alanine amidase